MLAVAVAALALRKPLLVRVALVAVVQALAVVLVQQQVQQTLVAVAAVVVTNQPPDRMALKAALVSSSSLTQPLKNSQAVSSHSVAATSFTRSRLLALLARSQRCLRLT